jgi:putative aldouronate transport system permease protein
MQNLPESLFDSARIDGARELRIYFSVVIPISMPVFASIAVFCAVGNWNAWFDVILYNSNGNWDTLQVYLTRILLEVEALRNVMDQQQAYSKFRNISPLTLRAATTMVVTIPIVFVYPFFQKYFVGGITLGAVKG